MQVAMYCGPNVVVGVSPLTTGPISQRLGTAGHNSSGKYINAAAFSQPAAFTFGNAPRTISNLRAPGYQNTDFSIFKNFQTTEWLKIQFRAASYNTLNQETFGSPNTTLSSPQFGQITGTYANANPRQLQFALKLLY